MLVILLSLIVSQIYNGAAQLSTQETLLEVVECDMAANVNITCGSGKMIVHESLRYYFHVRCDGDCCAYNATDSVVAASSLDTENIRRKCSGRSSCSFNVQSTQDFDIAINKIPSYIVLKYYCIPETRIMSVCDTGTISSDGLPMYLSSPNYPSVTTSRTSCSCSVEVYSCASDVNVFTVDVDLFLEPAHCTQRLQFTDVSETTLKDIQCANYYGSSIETNTLTSNYLIVNFLDNNTNDLEGLFFVGFEGSETGVETNITCTTAQPSWCVDCGSVPPVTSGTVTLDTNNSAYGETATLTCDPGYDASTAKITCVEEGSWETPTCSAKDCGSVPLVTSGAVTLDVTNNSTYGATATVTCDPGYETTTATITCGETGSWGTLTCTAKDCGAVPQVTSGTVTLDTNNSAYGETATLTCDPGYDASTAKITCVEEGSWETPTCSAKDCGSVPLVTSGAVTLDVTNNSTYGATATVTCDPGYETTTATITCGETGSWGTLTCTAKDGSDAGDSVGKEGFPAWAIALIVILITSVAGISILVAHRLCARNKRISATPEEGRQPVKGALHTPIDQQPPNDITSNGHQPLNEALHTPIVQEPPNDVTSNGHQPVNEALHTPIVQELPSDVTSNGHQPVNEALHTPIVQELPSDVTSNGHQPVNAALHESFVLERSTDVISNLPPIRTQSNINFLDSLNRMTSARDRTSMALLYDTHTDLRTPGDTGSA